MPLESTSEKLSTPNDWLCHRSLALSIIRDSAELRVGPRDSSLTGLAVSDRSCVSASFHKSFMTSRFTQYKHYTGDWITLNRAYKLEILITIQSDVILSFSVVFRVVDLNRCFFFVVIAGLTEMKAGSENVLCDAFLSSYFRWNYLAINGTWSKASLLTCIEKIRNMHSSVCSSAIVSLQSSVQETKGKLAQ